MKLTNLQIMNSEQVLAKLKTEELPILVAYKLNKVIKVIGEKLKFIHEQRDEIIKRYGHEENGTYLIDEKDQENINKFLNDFKAVLSIEEEVSIEIFELNDFVNVKISSDEFELVSFLFTE